MGNNKSKNKNISKEEGLEDSYTVPEPISDILYNSIARIEFKINGKNKMGTGFFIKINIKDKIYKFFVTCYHVIPLEIVKKKKLLMFFMENQEKKQKLILN